MRALRSDPRRSGAHQRVVTKLLLIICDCRISAIDSLQKRHTLDDNAGREIFVCAAVSTARWSHPGGYPRFPLKEKAVCRTAYVESDHKDLVFGQFLLSPTRCFKAISPPLAGCRLPTSFAQICKLIQNIMTQLGGSSRSAPARLGAARLRDACAKSLQGARAVLFSHCRWATGGFQ